MTTSNEEPATVDAIADSLWVELGRTIYRDALVRAIIAEKAVEGRSPQMRGLIVRPC